VALSPQTNYTDNLVSSFVDRGVSRGQRGGSPTVVNLSFLDRSRYFSFKVAGTVIIIIIISSSSSSSRSSSNSSSSRNGNYYSSSSSGGRAPRAVAVATCGDLR
jgi:hypothetical protein